MTCITNDCKFYDWSWFLQDRIHFFSWISRTVQATINSTDACAPRSHKYKFETTDSKNGLGNELCVRVGVKV